MIDLILNLFAIMTVIVALSIIQPILIINLVRTFKGLPWTFKVMYDDEKYLIRSHGKWINTGQKWGGYFNIYKCANCGAKICKGYFAFLDFWENDVKYKTKTCGEIIMQDILE